MMAAHPALPGRDANTRGAAGGFFLAQDDPRGLEAWLHAAGLLADGERVETVAPAGAGNMNCTLRVRTTQRALVVKQARPWVEKYPQFAAPPQRARREIEFHRLAAAHAILAAGLPAMLHGDEQSCVLVLEDLGGAGDYTDLYRGGALTGGESVRIARWLGALHRAYAGPPEPGLLANREMRDLNHQHIFDLPLRSGHGLDLDQFTPGLEAVAGGLRGDARLGAAAAELGRLYLEDGGRLVHGDFFPGSVLRTPAGPRFIDAEFAHFGRAEHDVGVWLAHLRLAGQPRAKEDDFWCAYAKPPEFDTGLAWRFMGIEVIRRLMGYAQLPLAVDLAGKRALLEEARRAVVEAAG